MRRLEIGEKTVLTCVAVQAGTVFLDMSSKAEGVLNAEEVCDENGKCAIKAGDKVSVYYAGNVDGEERFTTRIAENLVKGTADEKLETLKRAFDKGIPIEGKVEKEVKGGYEVAIGDTRAFCPFSQAGIIREEEKAIGRIFTFRITEVRDGGRSIIVSRRAIDEEEKEKVSKALSSKIHIGDIVEGKVESIRDFGVFIDIGGFTALIPISEIALERVEDVSKYLSVGQEVKVKVIGLDWAKSRVSGSLKALLKDPWEEAADKYKAGTKHEGIVYKTAPYGVFIELESGLTGLMHINTIEGLKSDTNIAKVYKKGEKVSVKVIDIDIVKKRISLSPTTSEEADRESKRYMARQDEEDTYNPFAALLKG